MDELQSLLVRFLGDSTSFDKMMKDAEATMTDADAKIKGVEASTVKLTSSSDRMAAAHKLAASNVAQFGGTYKEALAKAMVTIRETSSATDQLSEKLNKLNLSVSVLGMQASQAGGMLKGIGYGPLLDALGSAGKFEQTNVAFETMLQSASEAKTLLADLTMFAARTPFEMPEIEQAARGLVQFGEHGKELMDTLRILGNAASGTSSSFGEIALIFNQVRGVGKLLTQDFRQLSTRGIISLNDIAKHFGKTKEEAQDMLSSGKVSFEDLRAILKGLSEEGGRFNNMMEKQSQTLLGQWSTLKDSVNIAYRQIGESIAPVANAIMGPLIAMANKFGELPTAVKASIGVFLALTAVTGSVLTAFGTLIGVVAGLQASWGALSAAYLAVKVQALALLTVQNLLNVSMAVGYVAAIAAVAAGSYLLTRAIGDAFLGVSNFNDALKESNKLTGELMGKQDLKISSFVETVNKEEAPGKKKSMLEEEIARTKKEMLGLEDTLNRQRGNIEKLAPSWYTAYQGGRALWEGEKMALEDNIKLRDQQKNKMQQLQAILEKIPPDTTADEKDIQNAEKYLASLEAQIRVLRTSNEQEKIRELQQQKISTATIAHVGALQALLHMEEKRKKFEEYKSNMEEEIMLIGKTAEAVEKYKISKMKLSSAHTIELNALVDANKAAKDHQKLMEEGKELTKSLRSPLQVYNDTIANLNKLKNEGAIGEDVFNKAMKNAKQSYADATKEGENFNSTLRDSLFSMRSFTPSIVGLRADLVKMGAEPGNFSLSTDILEPPKPANVTSNAQLSLDTHKSLTFAGPTGDKVDNDMLKALRDIEKAITNQKGIELIEVQSLEK